MSVLLMNDDMDLCSIGNKIFDMDFFYSGEKVDVCDIDRAEMESLTSILKEDIPATPLAITYDNICVHEFYTDIPADPSRIFNNVREFAETQIDEAIYNLGTKTAVVMLSKDSWKIKNGFVTIHIRICYHTEYDESDFVFEDMAIHRVSVSMDAKFDTKHVYSSDSHAVKVFKEVNDFHLVLRNSLTSA